MIPPGPLAVTAARSIPRSLASLRTGGLASTCTAAPLPPATSPACAAGAAAGACGAGVRVEVTAGAEEAAGAAAAGTATGWVAPPAAGAGDEPAEAAGGLRARRLASVVLGP